MSIKNCVIVANGNIFNQIANVGDNTNVAIFSKDYIGIPYAKVFKNYVEALNFAKENFSAEVLDKCQFITVEGKYTDNITYIQLVKENLGGYTGYMLESLPTPSLQIH